MIRTIALVVCLLAPWVTMAEPVVSIRALVTGADPEHGQIAANLFDSKAHYMREPRAKLLVPVDADGGAQLDFGTHPAGEYAIVVTYDRNANGKLDTGLFGIPKEKIGFSNNARGRFGPAKWRAARFDASSDVMLSIALSQAKKKAD